MDYVKIATYSLIALIVIGLGGIIYKINSANNNLRLELEKKTQEATTANEASAQTAATLDKTKKDLAANVDSLKEIQDNLTKKDKLCGDLTKSLAEAEVNLASSSRAYQQAQTSLISAEEKFSKFTSDLGPYNSSIFYSLTRLGVTATNDELAKIPVADYNLVGYDTDGDGLSDAMERALGTDWKNPDTDGDGYDDKAEVLGDFNPKGAGKLALDSDLINKQKGKILLQTQSKGEAWYVSVFSGKRFFLGVPSEAVKILQEAGVEKVTVIMVDFAGSGAVI